MDPGLRQMARTLFTQKEAMGRTQMIVLAARDSFIKAHRAALVDFMEDALRVERWYLDPKNHDAAVAGRMDYSFYYDAARHALDWSANVLTDENLDWLKSLPYTYRIGEVGFSHGSPIDPKAYEYIFALEQARELMPHVADLPEVTFIGHSHLCKAFAIGNGEVNDVVAQKFGVRRGYKYIISVGSVGQPRDYDNRACFVVHDTDARTVEYVRVEYDIETSAQKIFDADLALNFGKRLFLGV